MRKALSLLLKAVASLMLLYFTLGRVDISTIRERLSQIDFNWVAFGLLALLIQTVGIAIRWRQLVIQCTATLSLPLAFRFCMNSTFFNQVLPSSVGGDAVRIWLLGRRAGWRPAFYSVFLDRVVGVVSLAIVVIACLPWTMNLITDPVGRVALFLLGFGSIGAGVAFLALSSERLGFLQRTKLTRHLSAVARVANGIMRSPGALAPVFGVSFIIHFLTALSVWCAARSIAAELTLLNSLFLTLPVLLVTAVPISIAGWGVRESAMIAAFSYAHLSQEDGLIVSLLFGAGYLVLGAIGGLVWIAAPDRLDRTTMLTSGNEDAIN